MVYLKVASELINTTSEKFNAASKHSERHQMINEQIGAERKCFLEKVLKSYNKKQDYLN